MIIPTAFTFLISISALFASIFFLIVHRKLNVNRHKKLPPGELGLPWIGETMEFYKAQRKNRIYEDFILPRTRKYGMTFKTRLIGSPTVIVNGPEANRFFLSNEFKLVVSSWPSSSVQLMGKNSIMEQQGERHRRTRGIISGCLGSPGLESILPRICTTVKTHLESNWLGRDTVTLYRSAKVFTFATVCECLMGIEPTEEMLGLFEKVLDGSFALAVDVPGTRFWKAKRTRNEIRRILVGVIRKKKTEMEEGVAKEGNGEGILLSRFVSGLIQGEVTEEEVVDNIVLLIFAAHDTTSFAIAATFKMLDLHPDCFTILLQEHEDIIRNKSSSTDEASNLSMEDIKKMKYTWQVARESMRLSPPIFGSFRKAIEDIDFNGFTIPKGWKVLWTTYGTHYNEACFSNPEIFDPKRFDDEVAPSPFVYVSFGGGPRICAGYPLARLNILIFVHYVVTRYNWSLVDPDETISMNPLPFPSKGMPIKISPKTSCV